MLKITDSREVRQILSDRVLIKMKMKTKIKNQTFAIGNGRFFFDFHFKIQLENEPQNRKSYFLKRPPRSKFGAGSAYGFCKTPNQKIKNFSNHCVPLLEIFDFEKFLEQYGN